MNQFLVMTKRNLLMYLREKGAVFFSLLTMLIIICLMLFFLGDMSIESLVETLGEFPGRDAAADKENALAWVLTWTSAGIITVNAVTVTISSLSVMMKDKTTQKLNAIYTAPVKRFTIAASYVAAAWVASIIMCVITLFLTEYYCVSNGLTWFSAATHIKLIGMIIVNSLLYAALMYFVACLVKTQGAWSGLGTVISTLVGFLGGIYIPIGGVSDTIANVMKCTPVIHGAAMFRQVMLEDISATTFSGIAKDVIPEYNKAMGIELTVFDHVLGVPEELSILIACSIIFLVAGVLALRFGKKADR